MIINIRPHKVPALAEQRKLLEHPQMRRALALHDVSEIFRLVQRFGVSQRRIAAKTGQSQSEISEILAGKRQVHAYYVLDRIATGFGVPRGIHGTRLRPIHNRPDGRPHSARRTSTPRRSPTVVRDLRN